MKRILLLGLASGMAAEMLLEFLGLGIPWMNGLLASVSAIIVLSIKNKNNHPEGSPATRPQDETE